MKRLSGRRWPGEEPCSRIFMNSAKSTARDIAKQIAKEPYELERAVMGQIGMPQVEKNEQSKLSHAEKSDSETKDKDAKEVNAEAKARSLRQAYESELKDIRREKMFQELLGKISNGEDVNLADHNELTWEQKQVLHAQKQALQNRKSKTDKNILNLSEPGAKRKRNLFAGVKTRLARVQRKSEIRMPPSG